MKQEINVWHRWYAWFPVMIDGQWYWRTTVERVYSNLDGRFTTTKHYRLVGSDDQYGFAGVATTRNAENEKK